jgi:catechol 2,3-dioxygenase-like lactoylglutathione lyase family enzyme
MMKFTGICLVTENVPALVHFYSKILGCPPEGDDTHAEFNFGGSSLAIFSREGIEEMAPGCMQGAGSGSITIGFEVADVDQQFEPIKALGVTMVKVPATYPWGTRSFWFRDPDGNIVNFYSRVAFLKSDH